AWLVLLAALVVPSSALADAPAAGSPGTVRFARAAESSFAPFVDAPSASQSQWMRDHYWRMRTYPPYFDSRLTWYPNAWFYKDSEVVYTSDPTATTHPEYILKDAAGHKLYNPFGCSGGTCPQYAGDIGSPAFRAWWIADAKASYAKGYRG